MAESGDGHRIRKMQSRTQCRRDKENAVFQELSELLPVTQDMKQDKLSVLRLTVAYLKLRENLETDEQDLDECLTSAGDSLVSLTQENAASAIHDSYTELEETPVTVLDNEGNVIAGKLDGMQRDNGRANIKLPDKVLSELEEKFISNPQEGAVDKDQQLKKLQKYKEGLERGMEEFLNQGLRSVTDLTSFQQHGNHHIEFTGNKSPTVQKQPSCNRRACRLKNSLQKYEDALKDQGNSDHTVSINTTNSGQALAHFEVTDESRLMLEAAPGFFVSVDREKRVLFVSENVSDFLGHSQSYVIGQDISEFVYEKDYPMLLRQMSDEQFQRGRSSQVRPWQVRRTFYLALKFCFQKPGSRSKDTGFALYQWNAKLRLCKKRDSGDICVKGLVALCRPVATDTLLSFENKGNMFTIKYAMDKRILYCDPRIKDFLGYDINELIGAKGMLYKHPCDSVICQHNMKDLLTKGQADTGYYRILSQNGKWVWTYSQLTVSYNKAGQPSHVTSRSCIISKEEVECVLSREKKEYDRMKGLGFGVDLDTIGMSQPTLATFTSAREIRTQRFGIGHKKAGGSGSKRPRLTQSPPPPPSSSSSSSSSVSSEHLSPPTDSPENDIIMSDLSISSKEQSSDLSPVQQVKTSHLPQMKEKSDVVDEIRISDLTENPDPFSSDQGVDLFDQVHQALINQQSVIANDKDTRNNATSSSCLTTSAEEPSKPSIMGTIDSLLSQTSFGSTEPSQMVLLSSSSSLSLSPSPYSTQMPLFSLETLSGDGMLSEERGNRIINNMCSSSNHLKNYPGQRCPMQTNTDDLTEEAHLNPHNQLHHDMMKSDIMAPLSAPTSIQSPECGLDFLDNVSILDKWLHSPSEETSSQSVSEVIQQSSSCGDVLLSSTSVSKLRLQGQTQNNETLLRTSEAQNLSGIAGSQVIHNNRSQQFQNQVGSPASTKFSLHKVPSTSVLSDSVLSNRSNSSVSNSSSSTYVSSLTFNFPRKTDSSNYDSSLKIPDAQVVSFSHNLSRRIHIITRSLPTQTGEKGSSENDSLQPEAVGSTSCQTPSLNSTKAATAAAVKLASLSDSVQTQHSPNLRSRQAMVSHQADMSGPCQSAETHLSDTVMDRRPEMDTLPSQGSSNYLTGSNGTQYLPNRCDMMKAGSSAMSGNSTQNQESGDGQDSSDIHQERSNQDALLPDDLADLILDSGIGSDLDQNLLGYLGF